MTEGSSLPEGTGSTNPVGCVTECCEHNCIADVFFPNAGGNPVKQFVNLPRESRFQGSSSEHQDRLTNQVRVGVRFQQAVSGNVNFRIELIPGSGNAVYSPAEKGRSHNLYQFSPETPQPHTISSGDRVVIDSDLSLTAAGGDTYQVRATCDQGHAHLSRPIEVWRRIWLQEIKMTGVPAATSIQPFTDYYRDSHHLVMRTGTRVEMERIETIENSDRRSRNRFRRIARRRYRQDDLAEIRRKRPHVMVVAYVNQIATKIERLRVSQQNASASGAVTIPIVQGASPRYLWKDLDSSDWYVSCHFVVAGTGSRITIPKGNCRAVPDHSSRPSKCKRVEVDLQGLVAAGTAGDVELVVNAVDFFIGGLAFTGKNLICVATKSFWYTTISDANQNGILVHELGHKLGMVPDGDAESTCDLDAGDFLYTDKGAVGTHCHSGLGPLSTYRGVTCNGTACCVMYGPGSRDSRTGDRRLPFCVDCAQSVNKVDMTGGWQEEF